MNNLDMTVKKVGDTFKASVPGWPYVGSGPTFKEAIGDWVYINHSGTNIKIDGPIFHPDPVTLGS